MGQRRPLVASSEIRNYAYAALAFVLIGLSVCLWGKIDASLTILDADTEARTRLMQTLDRRSDDTARQLNADLIMLGSGADLWLQSSEKSKEASQKVVDLLDKTNDSVASLNRLINNLDGSQKSIAAQVIATLQEIDQMSKHGEVLLDTSSQTMQNAGTLLANPDAQEFLRHMAGISRQVEEALIALRNPKDVPKWIKAVSFLVDILRYRYLVNSKPLIP